MNKERTMPTYEVEYTTHHNYHNDQFAGIARGRATDSSEKAIRGFTTRNR